MLKKTLVIASTVVGASAFGQVGVSTYSYNNHRTGVNSQETSLTVANVSKYFGKISSRKVGQQIRTQPLIATNIVAGGKLRNLLIVTTQDLKIYAYDADDMSQVAPIWTRTLPSDWPVFSTAKFGPPILVSTPVIDPQTNTLYVVGRSVAGDPFTPENWSFKLYSLSLGSGLDSRTPVPITYNGDTPFRPIDHVQRPALTLQDGKLYIAFGSYQDITPYHGWIFVYDVATMNQLKALCMSPSGTQSGVWQGGQGLTVDDAGNILAITGNGSVDQSKGSFGNSVIRINKSTSEIEDYFTPYNWDYLNKYDIDLGCGGLLHIPGRNIVIAPSKQGKLYVLDTNNLGGARKNDDTHALQAFQACEAHIHGTPIYWDGPNGPEVFVWSEEDYLKAFQFVNDRLVTSPLMKSAFPGPHGMPGGYMTLSSDGKKPGSAVLWVLLPWIGDANKSPAPGVLRAFDPETLREIWNSEKSIFDDSNILPKFLPPVVANGKVYVVSKEGMLNVYGLLGLDLPATPSAALQSGPDYLGINWAKVLNASSYKVFRSTATTGPWTLIGNPTTHAIVDRAIDKGTTYFYRVQSSNAKGDSVGYSQVTGATTPIANAVAYPAKAIFNSSVRGGAWANKVLTSTYLTVQNRTTEDTQALVMFDITSMPSNCDKIVLRLFGGNNENAVVPVTCFALQGNNWVQGKVTWNTKPASEADLSTVNVSKTIGWYEWDVTNYVKSALKAGKDRISLGVRSYSLNAAGISFRTNENTFGNPPALVATGEPTKFQFNSFANAQNLLLSGDAAVAAGQLAILNNGVNKAATAFFSTPLACSQYTTTFDFKVLDKNAEGITFTLSGNATDTGYRGQELGFGAEPVAGARIYTGAAIKFDFKNNVDEGANTTSLTFNGRSMVGPGTSLEANKINFSSGHVFRVRIVNTGAQINMSIRDTDTGALATKTFPANIWSHFTYQPVYFGFTGGTGSLGGATQILNWKFW
jgi:hypothetical protein